MNVKHKKTIYILLLFVLIVATIKKCHSLIYRPYTTRVHIARWFYGVSREYVEMGYKSGKFKNLCVSNITSLSELIPFREDKLPNNYRITLNDYYNVGFTNQSRYIISSVTPSGKVLKFNQNYVKREKKHYFWLYNKPSEQEYQLYRLFFIERQPLFLPDSEISWYYQCLIEDLTPAELEKEKEYRKKKGLPELN